MYTVSRSGSSAADVLRLLKQYNMPVELHEQKASDVYNFGAAADGTTVYMEGMISGRQTALLAKWRKVTRIEGCESKSRTGNGNEVRVGKGGGGCQMTRPL